MKLSAHNSVFTVYRTLFIIFFLLLGVAGIGSVIIENYTDIVIFNAKSGFDKQTLQTISLTIGILSLCAAFLVIFLAKERRCEKTDRRMQFRPVNFTDRRNDLDRRDDD